MSARGRSADRRARAVPDEVVVDDHEQAAALADPSLRPFLAPCMLGPATISEIAASRRCSLTTARRRVERLCELGLLEEVEPRPRAGRPMRQFVAIGRSFLVPAPYFDAEAFHRKTMELMDLRYFEAFRSTMRRTGYQLRVSTTPEGVISAIVESSAGLERWELPTSLRYTILSIPPAEEAAFRKELIALTSRYESEEPDRGTHSVVVALWPHPARPVPPIRPKGQRSSSSSS